LYTDEDIRQLCARVIKAQGPDFQSAIAELKVAFRGRIEDLSNFALATMLKVGRVGDSQSSTN